MNFDSSNPKVNINSASTSEELDDNPILPDAEVDSVILYLNSNKVAMDDCQQSSAIPKISTKRGYIYSSLSSNTDNYTEATISEYMSTNTTNTNGDMNEYEAVPTQDSKTNQIIANEDRNSGNSLSYSELGDMPSVVYPNQQVRFKKEDDKLLLILPTESKLPSSEVSSSEIWQQLQLRLNASKRLQSDNTLVHLIAGNHLLDVRQLQELAKMLGEHQMLLKSVSTSRRQTAIASATAGYSVEQVKVEPILTKQQYNDNFPTDSLYLEMTVRSGIEIRHPGSIIILGDVNPGGIVVADGDILIWGRLRGIAHAGAGGNRQCMIMALQMEPTQLRIANALARAPEKQVTQFYPEVAYIIKETIRITKTTELSRLQLSNPNLSDLG